MQHAWMRMFEISINDLRDFFVNRKFELLQAERLTKGRTRDIIQAQLRFVESTLIYLNRGVNDMGALKLALDAQALSLDEIIKKKQRSPSGLTQEIIELAEKLKPGSGRPLDTTQFKGNSISTKVSILRKKGVLPKNVKVMWADKQLYLVKEK